MSRGVVVLGGPTTAGKSALALRLAVEEDGEIVCADSRQIYTGLSIAAAGPTDDERARVPHHGFGVVDPAGEPMSAGRFVAFADRCIADILERDRLAIVVGGTGLYLRAWRLGLDAPREAGEPRRDMAAFLERPPRQVAAGARWLLVDAPLETLEPRIRARAESMFSAGIVEEAARLRERLPPEHALLQTLGTAEALALMDGTLDREGAIARTTLRTRQYARRQRTWFRRESWWSAPGAEGLSSPRDPR